MNHFKYINFAIVIFLTLLNTSIAQELDSNSFFPHSVGNIWEYDTPNGLSRIEIERDSLGNNGHIYLFYDSTYNPYWSIDTSTSTVYYSPNSLNWCYYKLGSYLGGFWVVHRYDTTSAAAFLAVVTNIYTAFIFGEIRTVKEIFYGDSPDTIYNPTTFWPHHSELLVSGIGKIRYWAEEPPGWHYEILRGCVIDRDTFGIITSVNEDFQLPEDIKLSQNFPNPCNSFTIIKYVLDTRQFVTLKIYDLLGREDATLVEGENPVGEYEVTFDASELPSGIYFYTLTSGNFTATKKLILLK